MFGYNLGVRERYDYTNGILSNSLFSLFLEKNGLNVWNNESTRDLICLDFDFGSRSYEEEMNHLTDLYNRAANIDAKEKVYSIMLKVEENKYKYHKLSKEEIRELFYQNNVAITYEKKDKHGAVISSEVIIYKMLYRNSSKAKLGQVMFINVDLYVMAFDWLTMGLGSKLPLNNAKIVEMSAYAPLTTSTIVDTLYIPVNDILILKDQDSYFTTLANTVKAEDYNGFERVLDNKKTEKAKQKAIENDHIDLLGNPIYKKIYKKIPAIKKKCIVVHEATTVKNTMWDGMGLIDTNALPNWVNGMGLLRNHFFKMCGFRCYLQMFFQDWCRATGNNYETYTVKDMFGVSHKIKDIKVVTTDNAIKWKKFIDIMGGTELSAYQYWKNRVELDGCLFGIVKTDHESKLGDVQQMSYQMINTLPCTKDDINDISQNSINYVETLKFDHVEFERFLRKNANKINHFEMMADLYRYNHDFSNSKWFRQEKRKIINTYVAKLRSGKITVNGDNLTICSNPYALLLYAVGEDWKNDPTLSHEDGTIQCYTTRFDDNEYLCAFRSPHNSPNNICYLHNHYSDEMKKYFPLSKNIIVVNCIKTDIQDRGNGLDHDSDFFFVTNHDTFVKYAAQCYRDYPTIVNKLKESGVTYKNTPVEYARMDNKFAMSKRGIGESSNLAQLALTYYWTKPSQELYDNFVILSVLAQVIIDGCKREYEVDALSEIERIKDMECMRQGERRTIDYPLFMKYTKEIPTTKGKKSLPYDEIKKKRDQINNRINPKLICPMNWLQERLDKIQGASQENTLPTEKFFIKMKGTATAKHLTKIRKLVEGYNDFVKLNHDRLFDDDFVLEFEKTTDAFYNEFNKMKIGNIITINRLIETALQIDTANNNPNVKSHIGSSYARRLLNALYHMNKDKFLVNFVEGNQK